MDEQYCKIHNVPLVPYYVNGQVVMTCPECVPVYIHFENMTFVTIEKKQDVVE